mgnify:CR=1 FL=1
MADQPISGLLEKSTALASDDLFVIVDTEASPDTTKKVKAENVLRSFAKVVKKAKGKK